MANIKSLSDLNGDGDDDDNRKHNDYYAGGEKRYGWKRRFRGPSW
jgi:UBX domain-containing protein 1